MKRDRKATDMHAQTRLRPTLAATIALALLAVTLGCETTPSDRIKANPDVYARFSPDAQQKIRRGDVEIGFTPDMVRLAKGEPDRVLSRREAGGVSETWMYESFVVHRPNDATYHFDRYFTEGPHDYNRDVKTRRAVERFDREAIHRHNYPFDYYEERYVELRVDFRDGKVVALERDDRQ